MFKPIIFSSVLITFLIAPAQANEDLESKGYSINYIAPIFHQLLAVRAPKGFHIDYEKASSAKYIVESVPIGETIKNWSQMFTITGYKGQAINPKLKPIHWVQGIANGFNKACPSSFSAKSLWQGKIGGFAAFAAVLGCGVSPTTSGKTSEMALIIVIKGEKDFYSIQLAERGDLSAKPIVIETKKWMKKLAAMQPIKLCKKIEGENAPYPSCIDKEQESSFPDH